MTKDEIACSKLFAATTTVRCSKAMPAWVKHKAQVTAGRLAAITAGPPPAKMAKK